MNYKCVVLQLGYSNPLTRYMLGNVELKSEIVVRDLGVEISYSLQIATDCCINACRYYYFSNRVAPTWNKLPANTNTVQSHNVKMFRALLND